MQHHQVLNGTLPQRVFHRLPEIYVICALFVTVLLSLVTPAFFPADEPAHALRALQVAHGQMVATRHTGEAGGDSDTGLLQAVMLMDSIDVRLRFPSARESHPEKSMQPAEIEALQHLQWTHQERYATFTNTAVYPPVLYLPQGIGLAFGLRESWTVLHSLMLARLLAAITAILLGWTALRFCSRVRPILFLILLLPSVLSLNASASQDALLFSIAALAVALLSRALTEGRDFTSVELVLAAVCVACWIAARVPYVPLVLCLLLPALNATRHAARRLLRPAVAVGAVLIVVGSWQLAVRNMGLVSGPGANLPEQKLFLKQHPVSAAGAIVVGVVRNETVAALKGIILLGSKDVRAYRWIYAAFALSLALAVVLSTRGCIQIWKARWTVVLAILGSLVAIALAEYLIWTPPGAHHVEGMQGRYFFPILMLLALVLPARPLLGWLPVRLPRRVTCAAYAVFLLIVMYTPWMWADRFYGMGLVQALRQVFS